MTGIVPEQRAEFPALPDDATWRAMRPSERRGIARNWYRARNAADRMLPLHRPTPVTLEMHRREVQHTVGALIAQQRLERLEVAAAAWAADASAARAEADGCRDVAARVRELTDGLLDNAGFAAADTEMIPRQRAGEQVAS